MDAGFKAVTESLTEALKEVGALQSKWDAEKRELLSKIARLEKRNRELESGSRSNDISDVDSRFKTVPASLHRKKRSQEGLANIINQMQEPPPILEPAMEPAQPRKALKLKRTLRHHLDSVRDLAFTPNKPMLVSCSWDRIVKLWVLDQANAKRRTLYPLSLRNTTRANACEVCGNVIVVGSVTGELNFWNVPRIKGRVNPYGEYYKPTKLGPTQSHTDCITSIKAQPSTRIFASASADGKIKIWNVDDRPRVPLMTTSPPNDIPTCLAFPPSGAPDSDTLFCGGADGGLFAYDVLSTAKLRFSTSLQKSLVYDIAVHPTASFVATAHRDYFVRFSDCRTGKSFEKTKAASDSVTSLSLSRNGTELITTSHDLSVRVWDVRHLARPMNLKRTVSCIQDLDKVDTHMMKGASEGVLRVRHHPSLPLVATAGADGVVRLFDV